MSPRSISRKLGSALRGAVYLAGLAVARALYALHLPLPAWLRRGFGRAGIVLPARGRHGGALVPPLEGMSRAYGAVAERWRRPAAQLEPPSEQDAEGPWRIAWLVPVWEPGSGGHRALFTIAHLLEQRGHTCSVWVLDPYQRLKVSDEEARRQINEYFVPLRGEVHMGLEGWRGADIAVATGWETAHPLWTLEGVKLRAYLVQDHEPDFFPASAERGWAEETYSLGYPAICSSPWLAELLRERYDARAETFEYAADLGIYRDLRRARDPDLVLFYAHRGKPRRGTPLGVLALEELKRRRPQTRIVVFGGRPWIDAPFEHEFLRVRSPEELTELYNVASAGLLISLTNYSLVPKEMMACGLPVVEVAGGSAGSVFGESGELITLADPNPTALADALEGLLSDPARAKRIATAARQYVEGLSWERAADQVQDHLRTFMRERVKD